MNNLPSHLAYCDELAVYIERASCAVMVLGELLEAAPENALSDGRTQSLGFLMKILGDAMMQRSLDGYKVIGGYCNAAQTAAETPA